MKQYVVVILKDETWFRSSVLSSDPSSAPKRFGQTSAHKGARPAFALSSFLHGSIFLWVSVFFVVNLCAYVCVCVCACAFTSVSPLKGLWFQRKPLCFLHLLATITKASAPLLLRLSTWIAAACFYVSTLQNCTVISQSGVSALGTQTDWRGMVGGGYFSKIVGL